MDGETNTGFSVIENCNCSSCSECTEKLNNSACSVVTLNTSITSQSGTCIYDPQNFNNKVFDCQGHTIDGNGTGNDVGIYISNKTGNTIKNCIITDFVYGIYLSSSSNNTLTNNTANNNNYGIYLDNADSNTFVSNTVKLNKKHGFYALSNSTGNILNANTFCSNNRSGGDYYDIYIYNVGTTTRNNNTCDTTYNYNDTYTTIGGCKNKCVECIYPKDVFDAVEMLEYLSGDKDLSNPPYCDLNNDNTINLLDVFALIAQIVIEE